MLSKLAGNYREWPASGPLREHVRCYWTHEVSHSVATTFQVVPDGCMDIVWTPSGVLVAGPDSSPHQAELPRRGLTVGVRFRPGVGPLWLGVPANKILDDRVELREFWKEDAAALSDENVMDGVAEGLVSALEAILRRRLVDVQDPGPSARRICSTVASRTGQGELDVSDLADTIGVSERTLRRRCDEHFGYGPKTLHRILRFQKLMNTVKNGEEVCPAELAFDSGFADQSHMTREVKRLGGMTPSQLFAQFAS